MPDIFSHKGRDDIVEGGVDHKNRRPIRVQKIVYVYMRPVIMEIGGVRIRFFRITVGNLVIVVQYRKVARFCRRTVCPYRRVARFKFWNQEWEVLCVRLFYGDFTPIRTKPDLFIYLFRIVVKL